MREVQKQRSSHVVHSIQVSDFALGFALGLALYTDCTEQVIPSRPYKLYWNGRFHSCFQSCVNCGYWSSSTEIWANLKHSWNFPDYLQRHFVYYVIQLCPIVWNTYLYLWITNLSSCIWEQGTGRNGFDRILKTWGREGKGRTVFMYLCICLPHSFSKAFYKRIKMTGSPEYSVSLFNPLMKTRPLGSSSTC